MGIILLAVAPLARIFSVELNVVISSRADDVRAAQQLGSLMFLPFGAIYLLSELNFIPLNVINCS